MNIDLFTIFYIEKVLNTLKLIINGHQRWYTVSFKNTYKFILCRQYFDVRVVEKLIICSRTVPRTTGVCLPIGRRPLRVEWTCPQRALLYSWCVHIETQGLVNSNKIHLSPIYSTFETCILLFVFVVTINDMLVFTNLQFFENYKVLFKFIFC